jgi:excisionase family DNA binding protein
MEPIKVEIVVPEEVLQQIAERVKKAVAEAFMENMDAIKSQNKKLTREEAAAKLKISLPTLAKFIKENDIPIQRVGNRILISEKSIENYLRETA